MSTKTDQINKLKTTLDGWYGELQKYTSWAFENDGILDSNELQTIHERLAKINKIQLRINQLEKQQAASIEQKQKTTKSAEDGKLKFEDDAIKVNGPEFIPAVKQTAANIGVDPNWLMAIMKSESGFSPSIVNQMGGATGLIQFMPATAQNLGTTTAALAAMSGVQQLTWVEKYFKSFGSLANQIKSPFDMYLLNFYPIAVGKPDDYILGSHDGSETTVYKYNSALDHDGDGKISVGDFKHHIMTSKRLEGAFDEPAENTENTNTANTEVQNAANVEANSSLSASVGAGGSNVLGDVKLVQQTLNQVNNAGLEEDGACGNLTITAIHNFQKQIFSGWSDGVIDKGGSTAKKLFSGDTSAGQINVVESVANAINGMLEKGKEMVGSLVDNIGSIFSENTTDEAVEELGIGAEVSDIYDSQLDNNRIILNYSKGYSGHNIGGDIQCNVTSLAMTLVNLANGDKNKVMSLTKKLIKKRGAQYNDKFGLPELLASLVDSVGTSIFGPSGLAIVAKMYPELCKGVQQIDKWYLTQDDFINTIVPELKKGAEVILGAFQTTDGHISSLLGVRSDGIVMNDPNGAWMGNTNPSSCYLGNGKPNGLYVGMYGAIKNNLEAYKPIIKRRLRFNGLYDKTIQAIESGSYLPNNLGAKSFYSWDDVAAVRIFWAQIYKK